MTPRYLCASADATRALWLQRTLADSSAVEAVPSDAAALIARIGQLAPSAVFIDFTASDASALAQAVRDACPGVPVVALGTLTSPLSAVVALRAGVRDFVDMNGSADDLLEVLRRLADERHDAPSSSPRAEPAHRNGKLTVLLGARAGMGVSTLAAHLAVAVHKSGEAARRTTALIDLGLPAGDGALMLDTPAALHFVDAVRNLRRFDQTFVNTAFARHASGLAFTTLPADLAAMRDISFASAVGTLNRLRAYFDRQIVDLGGFSNLEFVVQVALAADEVWIVCDPNVTSAVSAMTLVEALRASHAEPPEPQDAPPPNVGLIVNKFDAALNFGADQVAARLGLPLVAVLPQRAQALGRAVNQGRLLSECAERDPYLRALGPLVVRLGGEPHAASGQTHAQTHANGATPGLAHFLPTFLRRS